MKVSDIYAYLKRNKGITLGTTIGSADIIVDSGCCLRRIDDSSIVDLSWSTKGHAMIVTGHDEDGNIYVSSWGEKYIYEKSNNDNYINRFGKIWREALNEQD